MADKWCDAAADVVAAFDRLWKVEASKPLWPGNAGGGSWRSGGI